MQEVNRTDFWKERIGNAKRLGAMHLSVYATTGKDWEYISAVHKKVCEHYVSGKVLDVGCGYGRLSEWFPDYAGIDFSPDFIKEAKVLYPGKEFVCGDIKEMYFLDKEFDWAVCVSIKGMIEREMGSVEWAKMLMEIKRVAKNVLILEYSTPEKYEVYEDLHTIDVSKRSKIDKS